MTIWAMIDSFNVPMTGYVIDDDGLCQTLSNIAEPVWRNGRAYDAGPRGPGFKTTGFFPQPSELIGTIRWPTTLRMHIGPSTDYHSPI